MNKKVTKCIIMLLCTIFIWTGNMTTYAAETADPETSDLKPLELYQIDESYGDLDEAAMSISDSSSGTALSGVYRTNWDSYGDDYCYQNLSTDSDSNNHLHMSPNSYDRHQIVRFHCYYH